jgi:hypothetical protein
MRSVADLQGESRARNGRSDRPSPPSPDAGCNPAIPPSLPSPPAIQRIFGNACSALAAESTLVALLNRSRTAPRRVRRRAGCGAASPQSCAAPLNQLRRQAQRAAGRIGRAGVLVVVRAGQPLDLAQVDRRPPAAPCAIPPETPCGQRPTSRTPPASAPRRPDHPVIPGPCASWLARNRPSTSSTPITARSGPPRANSRPWRRNSRPSRRAGPDGPATGW